ncbi:MAG: hypothetical protein ACREON_14615 [Gemmatimonadaceae bacterium]
MRWLVRLAMLGSAFAIGTYWLGWWSVPATAVLWGLIAPTTPRASLYAAAAAALAWAALLSWSAIAAPVPTLATQLGAVMGMPAAALVLIVLIFPAVLAWSGAEVGRAARVLRPTSD